MLLVGVMQPRFHESMTGFDRSLSLQKQSCTGKPIDVVLAILGCLLRKQLMKWAIGWSFSLTLMVCPCVHVVERDYSVVIQRT